MQSFHIEFSGASHPVTNPWMGLYARMNVPVYPCVRGWKDKSVSFLSYNSHLDPPSELMPELQLEDFNF